MSAGSAYIRHLSPQEVELLLCGYHPSNMDEKWAIVTENDIVHLRRSWTGKEVYTARLSREENKSGSITNVEIEASANPFDSIEAFDFILDTIFRRNIAS